MAVILKGLISFSTNSDQVTGSIDANGTVPTFTTQLIPGDLIKLPSDSDIYLTTVKSIQSDIALTLTKPYLGSTGSSDYVSVVQNEIKAFLYKKIPDVYKEEIPEDQFQIVLNVISSAYLDLLPRIKEMKLLYDVNSVDLSQLPYIGYLFGFQFNENLGNVSTFLQQPVLQRNQVQNAVAWQKLKGSIFGIQQYLKTLAIGATIKELWYDDTFRELLDSKEEVLQASELWQKDITSNSIQYFTGNNGIDTSAINSLVDTVISDNLIYTPVVNTTLKVEISQQEITSLAACTFTLNSLSVQGVNFLSTVAAGDRIKLNSWDTWYTVQSITSDTELLLTEVSGVNGSGATSIIKQTKVVKTKLKQNINGDFIYDGLSLIPVNLGKVIIKSANKEPFYNAVNNKLYIRINTGPVQVISVAGGVGGYQTAGVMINKINNQLTGGVASGDGEGHIVIENQSNDISSTIEIIAGPNSIHEILGFNLGVYTAQTYTKYDAQTEFLSIQLLDPTDFSLLAGEINVTYDYINYTAPDSIQPFDYKTGAKSNWFDIELTALNSSFILLPNDVQLIINQVKQNVKPFHALLRTIRYVSGLIDTWEWKPDQPSFFKDWRELYLIEPTMRINDVLEPGSCPCQCCLKYNNCIKKVYNASINYNWGALIKTAIAGSTVFTNGSIIVTGGLVGTAIFSGTGLDDAYSNSGTYSGVTATFRVMIDSTGGVDTFIWNKDAGPWSASTPITAVGGPNNGVQALSDGVTIQFLTKTGHTLNDEWDIDVGTHFSTQLSAGDYIQPATGGAWFAVLTVVDDNNLILAQNYSGSNYIGQAMKDDIFNCDSFGIDYDDSPCLPYKMLITYNGYITAYGPATTPYVYDYAFVTSGIAQGRMIVYYDGSKYTDTKTGDTCIFHYDLGEFPKIAALNDEDYVMNINNNLIQATPQRVKEITGTATWFNGDTLVAATKNIYGECTFTNGSDIVVGNPGPGSNQTFFTTDLVVGDFIRPTTLASPWVTPLASYQVLAIIDDTHLQLTISYVDANYTGTVSKLAGGDFTTDLAPLDWIKPSSIGSTWYQVSSITSSQVLQLTSPYLGPTATETITDKLIASYTTYNITLSTGLLSADDIAGEINYQVGQQSTVDGVLNSATWTNGSDIVSAPVSTGNFDVVSPGDWIRNNSGSVWYQVDYIIDSDNVKITQVFADPTIAEAGVYGVQLLMSWGIPIGGGIGFVRLLAKVTIDPITHSKGAILLGDVANNAYTTLGFNKLYSKATPCYLLYNPSSSSVMQIIPVTGNVTMTNGSPNVTGISTFFSSELQTGDLMKLSTGTDSQWSFIAEVVDNTNIVLDGNYTGISGNEANVKIMRQIYDTRLTGIVSFINGNTAVSGVGTLFTSEVVIGDLIRLPGDSVWGEVALVNSDTSITLVAGYGGSTAASTFGTTRKVTPSVYVLGGPLTEADSVEMEVTTI